MTSITVTTQAGIHYHKDKPQETSYTQPTPMWFSVTVLVICTFILVRGIYTTFIKE